MYMTKDVKASEGVKDKAQTTQAAEATEEDVTLTLQDLAGLKQIIDVASSRGAFKPNEMVSVGQVYTKLENFLTTVKAQQKATQGA